jgi:hypothetical protein
MFWGLFKMMMYLVTLPVRIILKGAKMMVVMALPVLAMMAFRKMLGK